MEIPPGYFKTLARRRQRLLQLLEQPLVGGIGVPGKTLEFGQDCGFERPVILRRRSWQGAPSPEFIGGQTEKPDSVIFIRLRTNRVRFMARP